MSFEKSFRIQLKIDLAFPEIEQAVMIYNII